MDKGEEKMDVSLFVKADTLKRKTRELKEQLESLDGEISELQIKRKNFFV